MQVGNGLLTLNEQRSQMSLWALFKSPLMVSANLERIPYQSLALLTNPEVLAVNQDPLGSPGDLIFQDGPYQVRGHLAFWAIPWVCGCPTAGAKVSQGRRGIPARSGVAYGLRGWHTLCPCCAMWLKDCAGVTRQRQSKEDLWTMMDASVQA